jgi:hypothetical protein
MNPSFRLRQGLEKELHAGEDSSTSITSFWAAVKGYVLVHDIVHFEASIQAISADTRLEVTMIQVAILTRRLKEGKTYEDFRKAWYHTVGFGTPNRMYTVINAFDPQEIIVMGFTEITLEDFLSGLRIDVKERLDHSLDDVIEPSIGRTFGLLVSEDDFSAPGAIDYKPPTVHGEETNLEQFAQDLQKVANAISEASAERDRAREEKGGSGS